MVANHEVDNSEQLTHAGSDGYFEWFLPGTQTFVKCFDNWIATASGQSRHVKHLAYVLDQRAVVALAKLKKSAGSSHLVMGVFYWKHGLIEESEREFQELAQANPNSTAVAELLASIRSIRRR